MQRAVASAIAAGSVVAFSLGGCGSAREAGQIELLRVSPTGQLTPAFTLTDNPQLLPARRTLGGDFDEPVRFNDDVLTIQVLSGFIEELPFTLTGSKDIILFAEVWENSAMGYRAPALNSIVYVAENQAVPGKINALGNLAYGPTRYEGHPLKIKFTLLVLQKRKGKEQASSAQVVSGFISASASATPYGAIASQAVGVIREILRNQPDVVAFDFEATFLSDSPEGLTATLQLARGKVEEKQAALRHAVAAIGATSVPDTIAAMERLSGALSLSETLTPLNIETGRAITELKQAREAAEREVDTKASEIAALLPERPTDGVALTVAGQRALFSAKLADRMMEDIDRSAMPDRPRLSLSDHIERLSAAESVEPPREAIAKIEQAKGNVETAVINAKTKVLPVVADRIKEALQREEQKLFSEYKAAIASGGQGSRVSMWNASMPWLQYGVYALVQTDEKVAAASEHGSATQRRLRPVGWHQQYRFDGGWICAQERGSGDPETDRLRGNYIIFSVTPGQLSQQDNVLIAASTANEQLLGELRASPDAAAKIVESLDDFTQGLAESVLRERAETLARDAARSVEGSPAAETGFVQEFDRRWASFVGTLSGPATPDALKLERIKAAAKEKWAKRLKDLSRTPAS